MSQFLTCVVVDDELPARQAMCRQIERHCPSIRVLQACSNAAEAYDAVLKNAPDVVFLDIQMPGESGLEFLERFDNRNFYVVFCTTYHQYAVDAIRKQAFDYLLKPIDPDELKACARRVSRHFYEEKPQGSMGASHADRKVELQTSGQRHFVRYSDIDYIEACGSYSEIYLHNGRRITISKNLKKVEELLDDELFFRVHNSFLVRLPAVDSCNYRSNTLTLRNGSKVQMSTRRREEVRKRLAALMVDVGPMSSPQMAADDPEPFIRLSREGADE
jgi:two-component system LytT family response regulator